MPKFRYGTYLNIIRRRRNGTKQRYIRYSAGPRRGKYVHRDIVAARIGRELYDWEEVDHKDGNTLNDAPSNLSDPISTVEHMQLESERRERKKAEKRSKKKERATDFNFGANNGA